MRRFTKLVSVLLLVLLTACLLSSFAFAAKEADPAAIAAAENGTLLEEIKTENKGLAATLTIAIVGAVGAAGMAFVISTAIKGTARQPEAGSKIQSMMMLGLVFLETAIIYALIIALLIIFVL